MTSVKFGSPPALQMLQSFQLQGVWLLTSHRWYPRWGPRPDPYMGSLSRARHDQGSSPPNVISWPHPWIKFSPHSMSVGLPVYYGGQGGQTENQGGQTKKFFWRFAPNFIKQMFAHPGLKPCRRPWNMLSMIALLTFITKKCIFITKMQFKNIKKTFFKSLRYKHWATDNFTDHMSQPEADVNKLDKQEWLRISCTTIPDQNNASLLSSFIYTQVLHFLHIVTINIQQEQPDSCF